MDDEILDELYLLVCKQLINNPDFQLKIKAMKLIGVISSTVLPTIRMLFPLLNFFEAETRETEHFISQVKKRNK